MTADAETLAEAMVGIGPALAMDIGDYRAAFGAVECIDELAKVKGIGVALIEKNRNSITIDTDTDSGC